ncbi:Anthranilate synthase component [Thalictrum thalictroides]|uniref:anthranilate synthase n=1 Tax=Thalictrum thalictroides TaxID=46969 RepID=A0A7J6WFI8_THATH|nr:Anthranilate synthase component [Thalictrum thalictroides]
MAAAVALHSSTTPLITKPKPLTLTLISSSSSSKTLPPNRFLPSPKISYRSIPIRKDVGFTLKASAAITEVENSRVSINAKKVENPIVVIDNYDSFTYNLCQYMGELGCNFEVYRNDDLTVEDLARRNPRGILISPGPGSPQDSGISLETVLKLGPTIPVFGVCMGLQCIGEAFGGKVVRSPFGVVHGKSSLVYYDEHGEDGLFSGLPNPFTAGRYHSLGVQFHPESIITSEGRTIVGNFVKLVERFDAESMK